MSVKAILLGTAQDGGVPQAGCTCRHCRAARADPAQRQWVACLGLIDEDAGRCWLIDATPDLKEQAHALHQLAPGCQLAGILLTHAHIGHYTGLVQLGREAWATEGLPVYASARMARFLRANAPWSQLVALDHIRLMPLEPEAEVRLSPRLAVVPTAVPHRGEFSDTLAFVVRGPARVLFYCPDIDAWARWDRDLRRFVAGMDVALLDGTFFSAGELPGRDLQEIPHPLVTDTAERLAGVDCDVCLIHLNHSNPLLSTGPEQDWLQARDLQVGVFGAQWRLD
jgi:pyrroloquinoline quinone biosynthesis protein B